MYFQIPEQWLAGGLCLLLAAGTTQAQNDHVGYVYDVAPGSDAIRTHRLHSYEATWQQLQQGDDGLVPTGTTFEERLNVGTDEIRHTQTIRVLEGPVVVETRVFDPVTLLPISLHRSVANGMPENPQQVELTRDGLSWSGRAHFNDGREGTFEYTEETLAFDGWVAGLALAALPLGEGYEVNIPAVVQFQNATYLLRARVSGRHDFVASSSVRVPVWVVDTDWINVADGSVSKGGADNSGGTYLIAVSAEAGQPHVVEYANNSGVIRWML